MKEHIKNALKEIARQTPCSHENHRTDLGNGKIWASCEDCGLEFQRERLPEMQKRAKAFEDALSTIEKELKR